MGVLDILKGGYEAISGSGSGTGGSAGNGIFGKAMEMIGLKKAPGLAEDAINTKKLFEGARSGIFGEIGKSLFVRQFPMLAAITDIGTQLSGQKAPEVVPWQNEFETISSFLLLIPGGWKHHITDIFANSSVFRALVEYWPGLDGVDIGGIPLLGSLLPEAVAKGGNIRQRVLNDKDPAAVIGALRVMHQDLFVTGKVSFDKIKDLLGGSNLGAAAAALSGAAALAAGAKALEGGPGGGSGGATAVEAVAAAAAGKGALKGKNLLELQKKNPEIQVTTMQKKVMELLGALNVLDSAVLIKGEWAGNNDEVTVGYTYNNGIYFMTFDEDLFSSDISVRNSKGVQIYESTDKFGLDAESNAEEITEAMKGNPSETSAPATPSPTPVAAKPKTTPPAEKKAA